MRPGAGRKKLDKANSKQLGNMDLFNAHAWHIYVLIHINNVTCACGTFTCLQYFSWSGPSGDWLGCTMTNTLMFLCLGSLDWCDSFEQSEKVSLIQNPEWSDQKSSGPGMSSLWQAHLGFIPSCSVEDVDQRTVSLG